MGTKVLMGMLITGTLMTGGLASASEDDKLSFNLDQIVVTANRTPTKEFEAQANMSIISRDKIEKSHYVDLGDALKDVPGVNVQNYSAGGDNYTSNRLYINGSTNIVVLIDGMRANTNGSVSSVIQASEYGNLDTVERIEVLKGSASTLYGSDAVGGVINIITRKPADNTVKTTLTGIYGSAQKHTYKLMNQGSKNGIYWIVSAQKNKMGNYKDGNGNEIVNDLDADTYDVKIGKDFNEKTNLEFSFQKYKSEYQRPQRAGVTETQANFGNKDNTKFSLALKSKFTNELSNQFSIYLHKDKLNDNYKSTANLWMMDQETLGASDQLTFIKGQHVLIGGIDYYKDTMNKYYDKNTPNWNSTSISNTGAFLQDKIQMGALSITPGIRFTHNSEYGSNTSKSGIIGYDFNKLTNAYFSYKEFFVAPNQYQTNSPMGGRDLRPEEGHTVEFGLNHKFNDSASMSINIFKTNADNMIAFNNSTRKFYNSGAEEIRGWNFNLNKIFNKNVRMNFGYTHTYIDPASSTNNANRDGYIPKGQYNIGFNYDKDKVDTFINLRGIIDRPGRMVNEALVPDTLKSFWLVDFGVNYKATKAVKVFAKVNNLFDKFYTDQPYNMIPESSGWYSAQGRNFQVGVEYSF